MAVKWMAKAAGVQFGEVRQLAENAPRHLLRLGSATSGAAPRRERDARNAHAFAPYGMLLRQYASGGRKREQAPALQRNATVLSVDVGDRESQKSRRACSNGRGGAKYLWRAQQAAPLRDMAVVSGGRKF